MDKRWVSTRFGSGLDALEFREIEVPHPGPGEIQIAVEAAGVNPIDAKILGRLSDPSKLPFPIGYEVAGTIAALGAGAELASGGGAIGDPVLAFRIHGGYSTRVNVPAADAFARPEDVPVDEAAGLLLVGATAAEMLDRIDATRGSTILLHAASGAVGVSVLQQAAVLGVRVIGTCSKRGAAVVKRFGGIPTPYGPGLTERVRDLAPDGVAAALDAAGTDEAIETSIDLVDDRRRIVTIVRHELAAKLGIVAIGGANPESAAFRDAVRPSLIAMAAARELVVPISRTFPLADAREALELVASGDAGGKVVLHP